MAKCGWLEVEYAMHYRIIYYIQVYCGEDCACVELKKEK